MSPRPPDPPTPERLTAYHAGGLDAATRADIERWLADDAARRTLARLCDATAPAEPSEGQWAAVRRGIDDGLKTNPARPPRRVGVVVALATLAATVAAVLLLSVRGGETEPLPLVSADEVRVWGMDGDADVLLVGEPPVPAPLVLLTSAEVKVHAVAPDEDGRRARVETPADSDVPMIVMPPVGAAQAP